MKPIQTVVRFSVYTLLCLLFWQCSKDKDKNPAAIPTEPVLALSQAAVTFEAGETQKQITVNNAGSSELRWRAKENPDQPWLSIAPDSGKAGDQMTMAVNPAQLVPGTHNASIQFTSNGGDKTLALTVLISKLAVPDFLVGFESSEGSKQLQIQNLGAGKLNWSISERPDLPWLTANPASGENAATVTLTVDRSAAANVGSYSGSLLVTSTGGSDTVVVAMSKLPSSVFLDEFSAGLDNWTFSRSTGITKNGFLELTGTVSGYFGTASHQISPVRAAPWSYRLAFGRKNTSATASMVMQTDDIGTIFVSAFRFDLISGSDRNWQAAAFLFNLSTLQGGWALLENTSYSVSSRIKNTPGALNDVTWAMKSSRAIEISVDGAPFHQSNILNQLGLDITVGLEAVEIWAIYNSTTVADWALLRDVDQPGTALGKTAPSPAKAMVMELARKEAFRQFADGTLRSLPTLQEVYERIR
jgi:hypothetical protein